MSQLIGGSHRVQIFENWDALSDGQSRLAETIRNCIER